MENLSDICHARSILGDDFRIFGTLCALTLLILWVFDIILYLIVA